MLKFQFSIFYTFQEIRRQRALLWGRVGSIRFGSGQFIVLNDSASLRMVIRLDFNFFRFFKRSYQYIWLLIWTSLTRNQKCLTYLLLNLYRVYQLYFLKWKYCVRLWHCGSIFLRKENRAQLLPFYNKIWNTIYHNNLYIRNIYF